MRKIQDVPELEPSEVDVLAVVQTDTIDPTLAANAALIQPGGE